MTTENVTKKITVVSSQLANYIRPILKEFCLVDKETGTASCVSRDAVVTRLVKSHRKELPKSLVSNQQLLYFLVAAAVEAGQCGEGYRTRRGRNGGIYRDPSYKSA